MNTKSTNLQRCSTCHWAPTGACLDRTRDAEMAVLQPRTHLDHLETDRSGHSLLIKQCIGHAIILVERGSVVYPNMPQYGTHPIIIFLNVTYIIIVEFMIVY